MVSELTRTTLFQPSRATSPLENPAPFIKRVKHMIAVKNQPKPLAAQLGALDCPGVQQALTQLSVAPHVVHQQGVQQAWVALEAVFPMKAPSWNRGNPDKKTPKKKKPAKQKKAISPKKMRLYEALQAPLQQVVEKIGGA